MGAIGDLVTGLVGGIGDAAIKIRTAITGIDPAKQAELQQLVTQLEGQAMQAQTDINKQEAGNSNVFISGWRPFIGWICGAALAFNFVIRPLASWIALIIGHPVTLPILDWSELSPIVIGMLGLGTMRTVEKINGAQGNH